jgi:hypothetical protein
MAMKVYYTNPTIDKIKSAKTGFSLGYFILFPLYYLLTKRFIKFLIQVIIYGSLAFFVVPVFITISWFNPTTFLPWVQANVKVLADIVPKITELNTKILFSVGSYHVSTLALISGIALLLVHVYIASKYNKWRNKWYLKHGYRPEGDGDCEVLLRKKIISKRAYNKYISNKPQTQYSRSQSGNANFTANMTKYNLQQLEQTYRSGLMSKADYETRKQEILSSSH